MDSNDSKQINTNFRTFFLTTKRLGFSHWNKDDLALAQLLWGEENVSRYICKSGVFLQTEIENKLAVEVNNLQSFGVQYWPIFCLDSGELVGCCGLRPFGLRPVAEDGVFEIGFHLRSKFWGMGLAVESGARVIDYAFNHLGARTLYAGHNPQNLNSKKVLSKLGFCYERDCLYPPTGLMHPLYFLNKKA